MRFKDRVVIVTGGAGGLGAGIARRFAAEGAVVTVTDLKSPSPETLAHDRIRFFQQDVTDEAGWERLMHDVIERCGRLDVLVNNAGIEGPFESANIVGTRLSDWQKIQRVNVESVFLGCKAAIPAMARSGGGAIINMSSTAGLAGTPDYVAYGASKAAVRHLTKSIALFCARSGSKIRCNSIHPAVVRTDMIGRVTADIARRNNTDAEHELQKLLAYIPQGEFQEIDDIAAAALYLASDDAKHITGMALTLDGGVTQAL